MDNLGRCYELSFKYLISHSDWKLVHGYITNIFPPHQTIDHAWCIKNDIIYDVIYEEEFPLQVYQSLFKCEVENVYTYDEAIEKYEEFGHCGCWYEPKKLKSDEYYDKDGVLKKKYKDRKVENGLD